MSQITSGCGAEEEIKLECSIWTRIHLVSSFRFSGKMEIELFFLTMVINFFSDAKVRVINLNTLY